MTPFTSSTLSALRDPAPTSSEQGPSVSRECGATLIDIDAFRTMQRPPLDRPLAEITYHRLGTPLLAEGTLALPTDPREVNALVLFCVKQSLPSALSWLVVHANLQELNFAPRLRNGAITEHDNQSGRERELLTRADIRMLMAWAETIPVSIALTLMENTLDIHMIQILVSGLKKCHAIKSLDFQNCYLGYAQAHELGAALPAIRGLTALCLKDNQLMSKQGVVAICEGASHNSSLVTLDLSHNNILGDSAPAIAGLIRTNTHLQELILTGVGLSDRSFSQVVQALAGNTTLKRLDLDRHISSSALPGLLDIIRNNTGLTALVLSHNRFSPEQARELADTLRGNGNIRLHTLRLAACFPASGWDVDHQDDRSPNPGALDIAKALQENQTLQEIDLGNNWISVECDRELGKALRVNRVLERLILNNIKREETTDVVRHDYPLSGRNPITYPNDLIDGLRDNRSLKELHYSGFESSEENIAKLCAILEQDCIWQTLHISCNHFPDLASVRSFVEALGKNRSLNTVMFGGVDGPGMGEQVVLHLATAMRSNITLTCLEFNVDEQRLSTHASTALMYIRQKIVFNQMYEARIRGLAGLAFEVLWENSTPPIPTDVGAVIADYLMAQSDDDIRNVLTLAALVEVKNAGQDRANTVHH